MGLDTTAPLCVTDYPSIFRGYVVRSTQDILSRVRQVKGLLPPEEQEQALHTLSYALNLSEAWPDTCTLLLIMAPKMEQAGYRDEWIPYLEQGIRQSRALDDVEVETELHFQLGRLYRLRGKYREARIQFKASIEGFEHLKSLCRQARAMNRLAQVARLERKFEEAIYLAETALSLLNEADSECGYSYLVLGMTAVDNRAWLEGVNYFNQSLGVWQRENNQRMMGRCLMSLSAALLAMKKYQESLDVCQDAIALFGEIEDPVYQAISQMNLGNAYYWLDQPEEAVNYHLRARRVFRRAHDRFYLGHVNHNLGMAYCKLQQWDKAKEAYLLGIERYQQIGNVAWLVDSLDGLGVTYLEKGQHKEARTTFEEALSRLSKIEGEPGYEKYRKMVEAHLQETAKKSVRQQWLSVTG